MKTRFIIFLVMFLFPEFSIAKRKRFDGYQRWEVIAEKKHQAIIIHTLSEHNQIELVTSTVRLERPTEILVSPLKIGPIRKVMFDSHIQVKVITSDVQMPMDAMWRRLDAKTAYDPNDWNDLQQIYDELERLALSCSGDVICSTYSIGKSYEGRELMVLKISKTGSGRQAVWLDSLIHANEWLTGATLMRITDYLISGYGADGEVTRLVDTYDFYVLPVMNPDGYKYMWDTDVNWRKSRTINNGTMCVGVDLNRNYDYQWGNLGCIDPCGNTYHGISASSEPETQAVQNEALRLSSSIIMWISYHLTAYQWLTPYGYATEPDVCNYPDNYHNQLRVAEAAVRAIEEIGDDDWEAGGVCVTIYAASGITIDYTYAVAGVPYSFTPELRSMGDFDNSTIQPSFEENWAALVAAVYEIEEIANSY